MGYVSSMRIKTSITLPEDILQAIDKLQGRLQNRSAFIETVLREYIMQKKKKERDNTDLEILNRKSDQLNREAEDVLSYQVDL